MKCKIFLNFSEKILIAYFPIYVINSAGLEILFQENIKQKRKKRKLLEANNEKKEILNRTEVAQVLGVSLSQVERFRRAGKLPYIKLSHKCVRYRRSDCEKLLRAYTIGKGIEG